MAGINSSSKPNTNYRLFQVGDDKLVQINSKQTINSDDVEAYQRITEISPSSQIVVVDGKDKDKDSTSLHAFSYPEMEELFAKPIQLEGDILSANFNADGSLLSIATSRNVLVYSFKLDEKKKKVHYEVIQTISDPVVRKAPGANFRFAKWVYLLFVKYITDIHNQDLEEVFILQDYILLQIPHLHKRKKVHALDS